MKISPFPCILLPDPAGWLILVLLIILLLIALTSLAGLQ